MDSALNTWAIGVDAEANVWEPLTIDFHYSFLHSSEKRDYEFRSDGSLPPQLSGEDIGSNFPRLSNADHIIESSALYRIDDKWAARLFFRYQHSTIENFQQAGLTPLIGRFLSLGSIDRKFSASILGATIRYRF